MEFDLDRQLAHRGRRLDGRDGDPVPQFFVRSGANRVGDRSLPGDSPQERAVPLELDFRRDAARRHLPLRHADRDHRHQSGAGARRAGLWRAALPLRLAGAAARDVQLPRQRQRLLQDHAAAHRHADRQSGFLQQPARSPSGQHHAVQSVPARDPRFLSAGRGDVRVRRTRLHHRRTRFGLFVSARERNAVLLAQYGSGERLAREPHHRGKTVRRLRGLRRRRALRRDQRHRRHAAQPGALGRAHHQARG